MQLSLFAPQFDSQIRRTHHNEEMVYSIVDIVEYFTDASIAKRYWSDTKRRLEKEGFQVYDKIVQLKLLATDGKMRETDVANMDNCFRILMSIPTPKDDEKRQRLEEIKQWLASLGAKALDAKAALTRKQHIELYERAGYGNHPEILRLKDRDTNIKVFKSLKETIQKVVTSPQWAKIINTEYENLFGMITSELKEILNTEDVRGNMPSTALVALTFAERSLQDEINDYVDLSNEQIYEIIETIFKPIGKLLQQNSARRGIHHVTGVPLLSSNIDN